MSIDVPLDQRDRRFLEKRLGRLGHGLLGFGALIEGLAC